MPLVRNIFVRDLNSCGFAKAFREVAGAGTKGRYDQRLPSVSFALGLIYVLLNQESECYPVNTVFLGRRNPNHTESTRQRLPHCLHQVTSSTLTVTLGRLSRLEQNSWLTSLPQQKSIPDPTPILETMPSSAIAARPR